MATSTANEKFLASHRGWAQTHATASQEKIDLFKDVKGKPHLLLHGWPHPGSWHLITTCVPALKHKAKV